MKSKKYIFCIKDYSNILLSGIDKSKLDNVANKILENFENCKIISIKNNNDISKMLLEITKRYNDFVCNKVKNIKQYNKKYLDNQLQHIYIFIEELNEFKIDTLTYKEIIEIAKKGNNAGIHLLVSTSNIMESLSYGLYVNLPSQISVCECGEKTAKIHFNLNNDDCVVNYDSFIKS